MIISSPATDYRVPPPTGALAQSHNKTGTKSPAHYTFKGVPSSGGYAVARLKLTPTTPQKHATLEDEGLACTERVFQKLLLNFTWWVNHKDTEGVNISEGGFLGLDNIGVLNRSEPLPTGGILCQADGTAWMAFYCLNIHFIFIADAMTYPDGENKHAWSESESVGLIPLLCDSDTGAVRHEPAPRFKKRMNWFLETGPEVSGRNMVNMKARGRGERFLLALASKDRLISILEKMLDQSDFFSDTAFDRMLSSSGRPIEVAQGLAWKLTVKDTKSVIGPGSSSLECLVVTPTGAAQFASGKLPTHREPSEIRYNGDELQVECPTGSGGYMSLFRWPKRSSTRSPIFFGRDINGRRVLNGGNKKLDFDPSFRDYVWFYDVPP
ncbi:hypothetical protein EDB92DRAFT_1818414 [Lactarius akahatsu]|uniref:Uncharacterized protein n=1 Tax=Lactarius akahatsu TaxID=416441 RepID=A0AAD4Q859_9AGAM|nr:hypothetical protein EDB92DRAFT_1818414 [Lactarius akahatsu]